MCIVVIVSELCFFFLQRAALAGPPDILISTPACVAKCLSCGVLQAASINAPQKKKKQKINKEIV